VKRWKSFVSNVQLSATKMIVGIRIGYRSGPVNLYHCCVPKTGSQWIGKILSDPIFYRYSGLEGYHYQTSLPGGHDSRKISDRSFAAPFPKGTIVTPLYISFDNFTSLPKPERYKAFFVTRDPRDILISWYFSIKHSHALLGNISKLREILNGMSFDDGILYAMEHLDSSGHFQALASWVDGSRTDPNALVIRFEDLTGSTSVEVFEALFRHCDIHVPQKILRRLLTKYSFEALAGRKRGEERKEEHYRKGISGDWKNYLSDALARRFEELAGNVVSRLEHRVWILPILFQPIMIDLG